MSKVEVNQIDKQTGSTLTVGGSGTTVTLACGATQSGFGRTGTVDWCTTAKTSPFTAATGKGYMVNTCGGAITVTLPASPSAGDIVSMADYKSTFCTNAVTIGRNSSKINGTCQDGTLSTKNQSITLVYVDGTRGWKTVQDSTTDILISYISASGGNSCGTSGNYKWHKFTADGTFTVSSVGSGAPESDKASYVVVAGGGGGAGAGGGAGGFREGKNSNDPYTASPLDSATSLTLSASPGSYPITVGAGGAGGNAWNPGARVTDGNNSVFSTITSTAGGEGGWNGPSTPAGGDGGSGGGAGNGPGAGGSVGSGNTPPTTPPQGNDGGGSSPGPGANVGFGGGGGAGGAATAGTQSPPPGTANAGNGGAGVNSSITASPVGYSGGGGGGAQTSNPPGPSPTGGGTSSHGGGNGVSGDLNGISGTVNTGGGGGGNGGPDSYTSGTGGSGVVIIRYRYQ
jgi:hypothetical protein